ncbi:MAG: M1 family aminopeptidase [Gemmatimonadetes bacterium]|nr:M1 family aminopeptidase [Gemmatimonadota bacterium]
MPSSRRVLPFLAAVALACGRDLAIDLSPGVSWALAEHRAQTISELRYSITFNIPEDRDARIHGHEVVSFTLADTDSPVVFDFVEPAANVTAVRVDGVDVAYEAMNDHVVIASDALQSGPNAVEIEFLAGDGSLNRQDDFLYTLFVPDRARFAFPAFDQPNLKARYSLTLEIPAHWRAVANGIRRSHEIKGERATVVFSDTPPISSYLFSFVAGEFDVETVERDGRTLRMFHRETDSAKVARNREAVFDLHAAALRWLEEYTNIPYPFDKFDFVLIPSFQYGGMEHPGAILYREAGLLLDESATQNQLIGRASVIAHETAHMWFGDLVTMNWFDDVWTKEVFANFMAAKIVNPAFPEIDHDLRFFLAHYPAAYNVDRTRGANPIRQPLENLQEAGTLYGAIIYQKAPVVMKQLELLMGEEAFRDGLREYLQRYQFANATWPALVEILDARTDGELAGWSRIWVEEAGRPTIAAKVSVNEEVVTALEISQSDSWEQGRVWNQSLSVLLGYHDGAVRRFAVLLDTTAVDVPEAVGLPAPDYVLANGGAVGYGDFRLDPATRQYLLNHLPEIESPLARGIAWVSLWDGLLAGTVSPERVIALARTALDAETDELNIQLVLGYLTTAFWRYLPDDERAPLAPELEALLWRSTIGTPRQTLRSAYFGAYRNLALTDEAVARLERIWQGSETIPGLTLSETDFTALAAELALRQPDRAVGIVQEQLARITNPDRRARFEFVAPALSADRAVRDGFFEALTDARNREREPWVLQGMGYLHHPLRAEAAEAYIRPSLELLEEIQRTGDIFFPQRWLGATLGRHNSSRAAAIVLAFIEDRPDLPPRLMGKLLQAADPLLQAARIVDAPR